MSRNIAEMVADYKARGYTKHQSWDAYVKETGLKPEIDLKTLFSLYDSVSPKLYDLNAQHRGKEATHLLIDGSPKEVVILEEDEFRVRWYWPELDMSGSTPRTFIKSITEINR